MNIEKDKMYLVKIGYFTSPFTVRVLRVGCFRAFCKWRVHDLDTGRRYIDYGWISKRKFICRNEEK